MEKEENIGHENTSSEPLNENDVAEKQSSEEQEKQINIEEKKEISPKEKIKELEDKLTRTFA